MTNNSEILIEITRCKNDILYFVEKYIRVKTNNGNVSLHLTESQKRYLQKLKKTNKELLNISYNQILDKTEAIN